MCLKLLKRFSRHQRETCYTQSFWSVDIYPQLMKLASVVHWSQQTVGMLMKFWPKTTGQFSSEIIIFVTQSVLWRAMLVWSKWMVYLVLFGWEPYPLGDKQLFTFNPNWSTDQPYRWVTGRRGYVLLMFGKFTSASPVTAM